MSEFEKLIEAAKKGAVEDVRAIIHSHAELVNQKNEDGATALHYAAFGGHRLVAQILFQHGAEINATDTQFGATPAGWAIEYLRERGASWQSSLMTFLMQYSEGMLNGSDDSLVGSQPFVEPVTLAELPSSYLLIKLETWKLRACLNQILLSSTPHNRESVKEPPPPEISLTYPTTGSITGKQEVILRSARIVASLDRNRLEQ